MSRKPSRVVSSLYRGGLKNEEVDKAFPVVACPCVRLYLYCPLISFTIHIIQFTFMIILHGSVVVKICHANPCKTATMIQYKAETMFVAWPLQKYGQVIQTIFNLV